MNPSYLRVRWTVEEAMARYGRWLGLPEVAAPHPVGDREAIDLALVDGDWRGLAVYVFRSDPWTVFDDLSGGLAARPAEEWLRLAEGGDLVYAGYNDAIGYGELVRVDGGRLVRHFLQDEQDPAADVNVGALPEEAEARFASWIDLAGWVDEDEEQLTDRAQGWFWIHRAA